MNTRILARSIAVAALALLPVLSCGETPAGPDVTPPPPPPTPQPTTVSLAPGSLMFGALGDTARLVAAVMDANGHPIDDARVIWASADTSVATVDTAGLVMATGNGGTAITATAGSASAEAGVTVAQAAARMTISPLTLLFDAVGDTASLAAAVLDANGREVAGAVVAWSTADPSTAAVDQTGLVTASGVGVSEVTVTHDALSLSAAVEVLATPSGDREVLELLYRLWGGDSWNDRTNWLTDAPLSDWAGVRTDGNGRVVALRLNGNNAAGPMTAHLGLLDRLYALDLFDNSLYGRIPPELARLTNLRDLFLNRNDISGRVPPELGTLAALRNLSIEETNLSGPLPDTFARLALEQFFFGQSNLCLPSSLAAWFEGIRKTESDPIRCIPVTADRDVLVALYEATAGPDWDERDNWLTDAAINVWHGVKTNDEGYVTSISLSYNNLTGSLPPELGDLAHLDTLYLSINRLSGPIPPELGQMEALVELSLSDNRLSGPLPKEIGNLKNLKKLWFSDNAIRGPLPPEIGDMVSLEDLVFYRNQVSGSLPAELGRLRSLKLIGAQNNRLEGRIPASLGNLASLESLDLSINGFTGGIPRELGNLSNLEFLILFENKLSGAIPPELGKLAKLTRMSLGINELTGAIPPELGNLSALTELNFGRNRLSGPIPPELTALRSLTFLSVDGNNLSGPLPSEIGDLENLEFLRVGRNPGLRGLLPRSLLNLGSLSSFIAWETGLCAQIDAEFQSWLSRVGDARLEDCDAARVERLALSEFFARTGGGSWTRRDGWNTAAELDEWHGITLRDGRVRSVVLEDNGLTGPVPAEIANLTTLDTMNLGGNRLSGEFPVTVASMADLTSIRFSGNEDMEGRLPFGLIELTRLEALEYENTGLCASPAMTFQDWLGRVDVVAGAICGNLAEVGLSLPVVYLTQAIQRPDGDVPLIAGRDALLRVFLTSGESGAFFEPEVVATFTRDGREVHRVVMERYGDLLPTFADEAELDNSYNAVIPGEHIQPGLELAVEADPGGVVPLAPGSEVRVPASGATALNVIEVPPMELTVVPVLEAAEPDSSIFAWTDNVGDDSPEVGLFRYAFPFSEFSARSREAYFTSLDLTSDDGQWGLVLEMEALRAVDNGTGYYYAAAASVNGYVRGRARRAAWASIGKAWDTELAHEVGHNLDLPHAPCGGALNTDPDYPYPNGGIGAWGYDFRDGSVVSADRRRDIMGYCYEQGWLSDYYYEKVIEYRERVEGDQVRALIAAERPRAEMLVLWGGVVDGGLRIEPAFRMTAAARLPDEAGPYRIEGIGGAGEAEFSLAFTPGEDQFGDKYFFFMIPAEADWANSLDRITLTGPEGTVTVSADDERTISVVRDPANGRIRAILRDWTDALPAALDRIGDLDIVTSRGIGVRVGPPG